MSDINEITQDKRNRETLSQTREQRINQEASAKMLRWDEKLNYDYEISYKWVRLTLYNEIVGALL